MVLETRWTNYIGWSFPQLEIENFDYLCSGSKFFILHSSLFIFILQSYKIIFKYTNIYLIIFQVFI